MRECSKDPQARRDDCCEQATTRRNTHTSQYASTDLHQIFSSNILEVLPLVVNKAAFGADITMRRVLESWPKLRRRFPNCLFQFGTLSSWQQLARALAAYTYRTILCIERFYRLIQFLRYHFDLVFAEKILHRLILWLDSLFCQYGPIISLCLGIYTPFLWRTNGKPVIDAW